jgi:peptide/nickel transport system substrate-binding protein
MFLKPRPRHLSAGATAVVLSVLLAACGSALGKTDTSATGSKALTIGLSRQLTSLDPANSGSIDGDATVQAAIFSSLTRIGPDLKLVGDLAKDWSQQDSRTWVFHLHDGVKFANGAPLTAEVVVWNFERVLASNNTFSQGASLRPFLDKVTAPDATTVVITTKKPYLDLDERLSNFLFTEKSWVESHNPVLEPLGSGPYQLVSVDLENGARLKRNPHYYGSAPSYDTVEYKVLSTEAARVSALQTHAVDIAIQVEAQTLKQLSGDKRYVSGSQWSSWNMVLRFNEKKAPLDNQDVRVALNYAVDKQTISRSLLGSGIQPSPGQILIPPYDKVNPALSAYPYDPEKAKTLLAKAGYPNGFEVELQLSTGTYIASDSIAQVIAQQLGKVGVKVRITSAPFPAWVERSRTDNVAELIYIGYSSGFRAPAERLRIYSSTNSQSHYSDPTYDALVGKVTEAVAREEQQRYVNEATQRFFENPHVLFLWPQPLTWVADTSLVWKPRPEHWLLPQDIRPRS